MGSSLVLDFILIFIWRSLVNLFARIKSARWLRTKATVLSAVPPSATVPGAFVEVFYEFEARGKAFNGISKIPFLLNSSADDFARKLKRGTQIVVRFCPSLPTRSRFFLSDQETCPK